MAKSFLVTLAFTVLISFGGCRKPGISVGASSANGRGPAGLLGAAANPSALAIEPAHEKVERAVTRLVQLLTSVRDDDSARAAAPQLSQAAADFAEGTRQLKATVAALETAGRKAEVDQFFENLDARGDNPAGDQLTREIERVAQGPQGPLLRPQINAILDALLASASITARSHLQRWIQEKNLRR